MKKSPTRYKLKKVSKASQEPDHRLNIKWHLRAGVDGMSEHIICGGSIRTEVSSKRTDHTAYQRVRDGANVIRVSIYGLPKMIFITGIVTPAPTEVMKAATRSSLSSHVEKEKIRYVTDELAFVTN